MAFELYPEPTVPCLFSCFFTCLPKLPVACSLNSSAPLRLAALIFWGKRRRAHRPHPRAAANPPHCLGASKTTVGVWRGCQRSKPVPRGVGKADAFLHHAARSNPGTARPRGANTAQLCPRCAAGTCPCSPQAPVHRAPTKHVGSPVPSAGRQITPRLLAQARACRLLLQ